MKHIAFLVLGILLSSSVVSQETPDSTVTEPEGSTIVADPVPSDTTTAPAAVAEPEPSDTTTTPVLVAEPVPLDTATTPAAVMEPAPLDTTTTPAVVAAPSASDTSLTSVSAADTVLADTTEMAPTVVADTLLADTTVMTPPVVADTLKPDKVSAVPVVATAAVMAAPISKPPAPPAAPPTQLELYRAMYDTLRTKVFKYDFKPERVSLLLDSLRMNRERSIAELTVEHAALMETMTGLKGEHFGLQLNADSLAKVIAGHPDRTVLMSRLRELKELFDQGILTQTEFNALKAKELVKWE